MLDNAKYNNERYTNLLKDIHVFDGVDLGFVSDMLVSSFDFAARKFPSKSMWHQDGRDIFFLQHGHVVARMDEYDYGDKSFALQFYEAGDVLNLEDAFLPDAPHVGNTRGVSFHPLKGEVIVVALNRDFFMEMLKQEKTGTLLNNCTRSLCESLKKRNELTAVYHTQHNAGGKVKHVLGYLAEKFGEKVSGSDGTEGLLVAGASSGLMSSWTGVSREMVGRIYQEPGWLDGYKIYTRINKGPFSDTTMTDGGVIIAADSVENPEGRETQTAPLQAPEAGI